MFVVPNMHGIRRQAKHITSKAHKIPTANIEKRNIPNKQVKHSQNSNHQTPLLQLSNHNHIKILQM